MERVILGRLYKYKLEHRGKCSICKQTRKITHFRIDYHPRKGYVLPGEDYCEECAVLEGI